MRKPIIVGNWKMNKTIAETVAFIEAVDQEVKDSATWGIAVPYLALQEAKKQAKNLIVSAENLHFKDNGAYTGEVSAEMLKEIGIEWVIIGHSERRQYFGETDETVNLKVLQAIKNDITPIVCVGETLEQFEANTTEEVVRSQTNKAFQNCCPKCMEKVVIAYEPVWAIGTGKTASAEQAEEIHAHIRATLAAKYGNTVADDCTILYGGSANAGNAKELFSKPNVDGGLIGGASLAVDKFMPIIEAF